MMVGWLLVRTTEPSNARFNVVCRSGDVLEADSNGLRLTVAEIGRVWG